LCNVIGLRMHDHYNSADQQHLFVYVHIDKVGSSTIRSIIRQRVEKHNWLDVDCEVLNGMSQGEEQKTSAVNNDCLTAPANFMIQRNWGTCQHYEGVRSCKYIIQLREPVSRMISMYNYFCYSCEESLKFCGRLFEPHSCPSLSMVEFTRRYANIYTRKFGQVSPNMLSGGDYGGQPEGVADSGFTNKIHKSSVDDALANLQNVNVHVIALEDKDRMAKLSRILKDNDFNFETQVNVHKHQVVPNKEQLAAMRYLLKEDIQLYEQLFSSETFFRSVSNTSLEYDFYYFD